MLLDLKLLRAFFQLTQCWFLTSAQELVLAAGHRPEELKLDLSVDIILAQVSRSDLNLVPLKNSVDRFDDLRLVDWDVLTWLQLLVQNEKAQARFVQLRFWVKLRKLAVRRHFELLSLDLDFRVFDSCDLRVNKRAL